MLTSLPRVSGVALGLLLVLAAAACGTEVPASDVCSEPMTEALDPASGLHVLRPDEVRFDDPAPTSGPHLSTIGPTGAVDSTIAPAAQVSLLEQGGIVISVRGADVGTRAELAGLAGERVLVHPVDDLSSAVVLTAWQTRSTCRAVDVAFVEWFIETYVGRPDLSPGDHGG